ncbi:phosphotransferase family protein [Patulibacter defluvii]|uniref:phosphotransferase family protein n=1 Tax=Patulibacter defluvii TaxID=3095358 RepID=UPI002A7484FB|nr:phosphotransferase family protein [Patulibacter sp. DM4]
MALSNTTDPAVAAEQLTAWLGRVLPDAGEIEVTDLVVPQSSGLSNETILFDAGWTVAGERHQQRFVARVAPAGEGVFRTYDLAKEFRILRALGEQPGVPVPRVWWLEEDPSVLGAAFLVMSRVDGRVPSDDPPFTASGWVLDLAPEQRGRLHDNALRALAAIHAVDWRAIGLGDLAPAAGVSALDHDIAQWRATFDWARAGDENPTVEAAFRWIAEHRPADEGEAVLNWGDARVGNVLFGDDLEAAAVLDWEMVTVGPRELELGWWLFLQRHHTEGIGVPRPEGWPTREQVIARYEELTGHEVREIDFYEVWAATRLASIMHRAGNMMIAAGLLPPDAPMRTNNPASQLLARLIGLEAPTGEAQSFIGNRG